MRGAHGQRGASTPSIVATAVFVGTLLALVGPEFIGPIDFGTGDLYIAAESQMLRFEEAIEAWRDRHGRVPDDLDALTRATAPDLHPPMRSIPLDPWGNPYRYERLDDRCFRLVSWGEDGLPDTEDDLGWPETSDG